MADVTPSAVPGPSSTGSGGDDWPAQAADTIVRVVGEVRDRTTGNAITAARAVVYGIIAAVLGTVALVLACILLARGLVIVVNLVLDGVDQDRPGRANWITDVILGLGFALGGLVLWKKATSAAAD